MFWLVFDTNSVAAIVVGALLLFAGLALAFIGAKTKLLLCTIGIIMALAGVYIGDIRLSIGERPVLSQR